MRTHPNRNPPILVKTPKRIDSTPQSAPLIRTENVPKPIL